MADAVLDADALRAVATRVLVGMGAPDDLAAHVARSLVLSNLVGHDSHGIIRLIEYSGWVRAGELVPHARPALAWSKGAASLVDGGWGWGQVAASLAVETVAGLARTYRTGTAVLSRTHHIGRLGEYVDEMASAGLMGIAFCNTGGAVVAPFGGIKRVLGTNPFAWAIPGPVGDNVVLDFSTAVIAAGKVVLAAMSGKEIEGGALIDRHGSPSTDAAELNAGGALRAFGEHKGSGLSALIELTAGLFSGNLPAALSHSGYGNGTVFIAVDLSSYVAVDDFTDVVRRFAEIVHDSSPPDGGERALLPGEMESRTQAHRRAHGIVLPDGVRHNVVELAAEFGVAVPELG